MIVVKLMGGLGNQMFQYAAGRRAAWRHNALLKLDLSLLEGDQGSDTPRRFQLDHLCINAGTASPQEVADITAQGEGTVLGRVMQRVGLRPPSRVYREKYFQFDPQILDIPDDSYLQGYWQSERYFADIRDIILKEFCVRDPLAGRNLQLAEEIRRENSVSLHIRRGDYFSSAAINAVHGTCSLPYFYDAAARVASEVTAPHFFVFSDDPDWVKEHLRLPHAMTVLEHNGPDAGHEDMRLMTMCRHHIIANSSFSWWGGWLDPRSDKMVIAPSRWFNDATVDTGDLLPASWLRLAT